MLYVELLVHHKVIASKLGFGSLFARILFYKGVEILRHLMKFGPKDTKMYFCNKFKIRQLNVYFEIR